MRFCNDSKQSYGSSYDFLESKKPETKKQWLRIGMTPLWLHVTYTLSRKIAKCLEKLNMTGEKLFFEEILITASKSDIHYMRKLAPGYISSGVRDIGSLGEVQDTNFLCGELGLGCNETGKNETGKIWDLSFKRATDEHLAEDSKESHCRPYAHINRNPKIPIHIVEGGNSRFASLKNALKFIESRFLESNQNMESNGLDSHYVIVNDCARFNTKKRVLYKMLKAMCNKDFDCIAPYIGVSDTVAYYGFEGAGFKAQKDKKQLLDSIALTSTLESSFNPQKYIHLKRESLRLIQTPQISKTSLLLESMKLGVDFSDESSAINALPHTHIKLLKGDSQMGKLTTKSDLPLLLPLLKKMSKSRKKSRDSEKYSVLIGQGSDIHAFECGVGKQMWLCGVRIMKMESSKGGNLDSKDSDFSDTDSKNTDPKNLSVKSIGFKAHSDGDVGLHALIDSILGAMSCGDIGEIFPDSDSQLKGVDSKILLKRVYDYCLSTGLEIVNVDITLIAQMPKITPYKSQMQEIIARILYLQKSQVSIKATTAEHLGFIGRKEGVLAQSIAQLKVRDVF